MKKFAPPAKVCSLPLRKVIPRIIAGKKEILL
jgi:hypothetical protein